MSLLERFVLMFETDAGEASGDVEDLNRGLNDTESSAKKATKSVDNMVGSVKKLVAAYLGFQAIKSSILDIARADDVVAKFSHTLGLNADDVDAYSAAVERSGGSAEGFRGSIAGLQDQLQNFEKFGVGDVAENLARIGVSAVDSMGKVKGAFELLPEIAQAFEGMDAASSRAFAKRLGFDQGTILLLQQTRYQMENLVEQQRQYGGMTRESNKASEDFNDALDNSSRKFKSVFQKINAKLLPILTKLINGFDGITEWINKHQDAVIGFFVTLATVITVRAIPAIVAFTLALLTNPLVLFASLIIGIAAAIGILYEDLNAYMNGESSLVGDLIKKYPELKSVVDGFIAGVKLAWDTLKSYIDWIVLLFDDPMAAMEQLKQGFVNLFNYIKELFDFSFIGDRIDKALDDVKEFFGIEGDKITPSNNINPDDFPDLPTFGSNDILGNTQKGLAIQQMYASNPVNTMNSSMMNVNNSVSRGSINISVPSISIDARGMTPDQAQSVVNNSLAEQIAYAIGHFNDGVNA